MSVKKTAIIVTATLILAAIGVGIYLWVVAKPSVGTSVEGVTVVPVAQEIKTPDVRVDIQTNAIIIQREYRDGVYPLKLPNELSLRIQQNASRTKMIYKRLNKQSFCLEAESKGVTYSITIVGINETSAKVVKSRCQ